MLWQRLERAHVVQAIRELDEDDPNIGGHRHHHLAVVLGLALVTALEGDLRQLRDAVYEPCNLIPELLADVGEAGARVLDRVVKECRAKGWLIQAQAGADFCHFERVVDEALTGAAPLIGVSLACECEGTLDFLVVASAVGALGVLRYNREQITEQLSLVLR